MRSILLASAIAAAYAFLRGWPDGLSPLLRGCFAVLALVLGFGLWCRHDKPAGDRTTAVRPARWPDYLAMGLGVLSIECLFLFFLTVTPPKAEEIALSLEATLHPELAAQRRRANHAPDGIGRNTSGNWLWDSQGNRSLPKRTAARPSNKPEVFFRADDGITAARLLRWRAYISAFALERYKEATWSPLPIPSETLSANPDGFIPLPQPETRPGPILSGEIFHNLHPGGQDVLTAPQGLTAVELPTLRKIAPGIFRLKPLPRSGSGYQYRTSSQPLTLESLLHGNSALNLQGAPEAPAHLLALPAESELRDKLFQIAVMTQGPIEDRLLSLKKFLGENCEYSLTVTNQNDRDPIDNFLFHERRGHCEFFATAAALLCRALGIPSRIAYGWSGGRYYEAQNLIMFRAREAHAWTEILLDGYGWVIFDTTPSGALEAALSSVAPPGEIPALDDDGNITDPPVEDNAPTNGWSWTALAAGATLLPLCLLILALRKKPRSSVRPEAQFLLPDPPGYLTRFRHACRSRGHPMPPGRTLRQHLAHLTERDLAPAFADELLDYHYTTTYGPTPHDRTREKALGKAIAAWG